MSDSNSQEKDKQKNAQGGKERRKVKYKKCRVCGAIKKAEDMFTEFKCSDIECFQMLCYDNNMEKMEKGPNHGKKKTI